MVGGNIDNDIAGGPVRHQPVMLDEVLACLAPGQGKTIVDGTFGAGGYSNAILEQGASVIAIDRDPQAIRDGSVLVARYGDQLKLVGAEFSKLDDIARDHGHSNVDGVVLDVGVSSMQLDEVERGFSFQNDGPLDMRMAQSGPSAADVVNNASQSDLTRIIGLLGEERKASLVSREIVRARDKEPFSTTQQLVKAITKALPRKFSDRIHPATRTFQALRIFVNQELEELAKALFAAEGILKTGGRLVVVTFHSLEDRIVKLFLRDRSESGAVNRHLPSVNTREANFILEGNGLIKVSRTEAEFNPRARSAKLRWASRTGNPSRPPDMAIYGLPDLIQLSRLASVGN